MDPYDQPKGLVPDALMKEFSNSASESDNVSGSLQVSPTTLSLESAEPDPPTILLGIGNGLLLGATAREDGDRGLTEKLFNSAPGEGTVELGIALKVITPGGGADFCSPAYVGEVIRKIALIFPVTFFFFGTFSFGNSIRRDIKSSGEIP